MAPQASQFCLYHSRAKKEGKFGNNSSKLVEQNQEKKSKDSGYKCQIKQQSIAGCRPLLRTLLRGANTKPEESQPNL